MATPTFFLPPPTADEVARRLEEEVNRQREATPEPVFCRPNATQSYDYMCEIEHRRFISHEVDAFRMRIAKPNYWECEARRYKDCLSELVWQNLLHEYSADSVPTTNSWRDIAMAYRRRLRRHGFSEQQLRECRLSIEDQAYWQPEAELLRAMAALREHETRENHWKMKSNIQGILSPVENETQYGYLEEKPRHQHQHHPLIKQPTRRSQRSVGQPQANSAVSNKRKSALRRSTRSKIERRRGRLRG